MARDAPQMLSAHIQGDRSHYWRPGLGVGLWGSCPTAGPHPPGKGALSRYRVLPQAGAGPQRAGLDKKAAAVADPPAALKTKGAWGFSQPMGFSQRPTPPSCAQGPPASTPGSPRPWEGRVPGRHQTTTTRSPSCSPSSPQPRAKLWKPGHHLSPQNLQPHPTLHTQSLSRVTLKMK